MTAIVHFNRYDRQSKVDGFSYQLTDRPQDLEHDLQTVSMSKLGFCLHMRVQNYTGEKVFLGNNLRSSPMEIRSLQGDGYRYAEQYNNFVIIQIFSQENVSNVDPKKRVQQRLKTEIRVPARMLNIGTVFIEEINAYLMTESQVDATRELIVKDVQHQGWEHITVPQAMMKTDPSTLYIQYKQLAEYCIRHQDKLSIRVGVDLEYSKVPDIIKNMRVAILDSYFVPFKAYKLVYDPTLGRDDFVLENLHMASTQSFRSTWSELSEQQTMYLDQDEVDTISGKFYGLVLFSGEKGLLNYVHARKSEDRFSHENLYVSNRTGDPLLREKLSQLTLLANNQAATIADHAATIQSLRNDNKQLTTDITQRERTITQLRSGHAAKMSTEIVLGEMNNDRTRSQNERDKIFHEAKDLEQKTAAQPFTQRAQLWKTWSEVIKSGWAIVAAVAGGILSTIALMKKHKLKLSTT